MIVPLRNTKENKMFHLAGALIDLNHPARYFKFGPIQISVGNATVIGLMILIFAFAMVVPFPGDKNE